MGWAAAIQEAAPRSPTMLPASFDVMVGRLTVDVRNTSGVATTFCRRSKKTKVQNKLLILKNNSAQRRYVLCTHPRAKNQRLLHEHPLYQVGAGQPSVTGHPSVSFRLLKEIFIVKLAFTNSQ
jgi:hypothetical protein